MSDSPGQCPLCERQPRSWVNGTAVSMVECGCGLCLTRERWEKLSAIHTERDDALQSLQDAVREGEALRAKIRTLDAENERLRVMILEWNDFHERIGIKWVPGTIHARIHEEARHIAGEEGG